MSKVAHQETLDPPSPEDGSNFRRSLEIDMKGLVGDAVGNVSVVFIGLFETCWARPKNLYATGQGIHCTPCRGYITGDALIMIFNSPPPVGV